MTTLKFVDTHNMVAFLSKPVESDGFKQIVDFLNAQPIRDALTVNPTIYISCIKQFWSTGVVKSINGEVQLHALVDGKKIIISEASMRRDLKLEDEEGMVKILDNVSGKFLMYPKFVQVFLNQQLDGLPTHKRIYNAPSHTKKIFGNMRRVGKGFYSRVTPLFPTMVVQNQAELGEGLAIPTDPHHTPTIIESSSHPQKTKKPRKPKRNDTQVPQPSDPSDNVADEVVHKELGDSLVRAATTASSLEAEQDNGNITKTRFKATPNESSSLVTTSGGGPRHQETMGDNIAQTRFENVSKLSNDSLLVRGNTLQSDEDRLKLNELMELCTNLQKKVLDLEKTKTTQANEIGSLKRRVKKLEKKRSSRTHNLKRLYKVGLSARVESYSDEEDLGDDASKQGRINAIDANEDIILVNVQDDANKEMFDMDALNSEEVFIAGQNENVVEEVVDAAQVGTATITVTITTEEITLAQAIKALKTSKPKVKGIIFQEPEVKGWLDEDLDNYHLKELRCSTQCHTQMSMWIISRGVVLLILLMLGISFKFDISGLLPHVITTIAYRIRGSKLEYKFQDQENSEDIFSFGSALEDFICVVFVPDRNIIIRLDFILGYRLQQKCLGYLIHYVRSFDRKTINLEEIAFAATYLKDTLGNEGIQELSSNLCKDREEYTVIMLRGQRERLQELKRVIKFSERLDDISSRITVGPAPRIFVDQRSCRGCYGLGSNILL
ncbi:hypothetical protein Tco_0596716 [Tanacetum coccineum]